MLSSHMWVYACMYCIYKCNNLTSNVSQMAFSASSSGTLSSTSSSRVSHQMSPYKSPRNLSAIFIERFCEPRSSRNGLFLPTFSATNLLILHGSSEEAFEDPVINHMTIECFLQIPNKKLKYTRSTV